MIYLYSLFILQLFICYIFYAKIIFFNKKMEINKYKIFYNMKNDEKINLLSLMLQNG